MEIKQLKLNGTAFYPKVGVDSIVNAAGEASAVDTVVTENSSNLITSGAVYDAIQEGGGGGASVNVEVYDVTAMNNWQHTDNGWQFLQFSGAAVFDMFDNFSNGYPKKPCLMKLTYAGGGILTLTPTYVKKDDSGPYYTIYLQATETDTQGLMNRSVLYTYAMSIYNGDGTCFLYRKQVPIITDDALDANSTNPVQNKVVNSAISSLGQSKQDALVSGTNIKTINNESILGSGNITIGGGGSADIKTLHTDDEQNVSLAGVGTVGFQGTNGIVTSSNGSNLVIGLTSQMTDTIAGKANQSEVTNLATTVGNQASAITALNTAVFKNGDNQFNVVNGRIDSISSVLDSALTDIENVETAVADKQDTLVSGTNIKTVNGNSLLGSGNIEIGGSGTIDAQMSNSSANPVQNKVVAENLLSITPIIKSESSFGSSCIQVINQLRINGTQINPWQKEGQATFDPALIEFTVGVVDINSSTRALNKHTFSYTISPGEGTEPTVSGREYNYQSLVDKFVSDLCEYYAGFSNGGSNSMIIRKTRDESYANVEFTVNITSTSQNTNHYQIVLSSFELAGYDTTGKDNKVISLALTTSSTMPETRSDIFYKTMSISKGDLGTIVTNPQTLWFNTTINHLMILDGQGIIYDCTTGGKFTFAPNYQ